MSDPRRSAAPVHNFGVYQRHIRRFRTLCVGVLWVATLTAFDATAAAQNPARLTNQIW
jgi:hypothetical protein